VSVYDVAQACCLVLDRPESAGGVFNVGSGCSYAIRDIAEGIARVIGKEYLEPEITGKYRVGDIRHCFADISRARSVLGYVPKVSLEEGLEELAAWLGDQEATDRVEQASAELAARGLTV
jgi:dTDP-L-rhamnose 4-epimerase